MFILVPSLDRYYISAPSIANPMPSFLVIFRDVSFLLFTIVGFVDFF